MLSVEGNENGEKTTIGLISKKATLHVLHTFFVHFFAVVLPDYDVKLPETSQLHNFWRKTSNVFSFTFSMPLIFTLHWWLQAFVTTATKFPTKKNCFLCFFISCSRSLSSFHSLSFAGLPPTFSLSLSFSCSIFQICGRDN